MATAAILAVLMVMVFGMTAAILAVLMVMVFGMAATVLAVLMVMVFGMAAAILVVRVAGRSACVLVSFVRAARTGLMMMMHSYTAFVIRGYSTIIP